MSGSSLRYPRGSAARRAWLNAWPRVLAVAAILVAACTPQGDPRIAAAGFTDDFEREKLGDLWRRTGGNYRIREGRVFVRGARNKPLWLRKTLPRDVRIEFDVRSDSNAGDIKVELFGDGTSYAKTTSYTATGYVVIFGGWQNRLNVIARMDEHGDDRAVGPRFPVQPGKTYRIRIERRGQTLVAWADDHELARLRDPAPLYGPGHDHFAFNNWQSELHFDNLRIQPL